MVHSNPGERPCLPLKAGIKINGVNFGSISGFFLNVTWPPFHSRHSGFDVWKLNEGLGLFRSDLKDFLLYRSRKTDQPVLY